ncbi:MAG: adenylate/guanylate cyclase domain-containing protein [Bacteroidota bacterium]|nr:adenylate/guanylate cyclase domain-containing protein [uncultured Allomuricauda sp.]
MNLNERRWRILRFFMIGWTFAFIFLSIVRGLGTQELGELKFSFKESLLIACTLGPIMGFVSGMAQITIEERFYKYVPLKRLLLIQLVYIICFLLLVTVVAYGVYHLYFGIEISFWRFASDKGSGAIFFFVVFTDFALSLLRQVDLMLGEGNLSKLIRGRFYSPREEHRIFMFLDLQSSTTLAERLGHIKYSKLIQDCFNDMGVVVGNKAEIYQYVGDEAVLTWEFKDGIKDQNCIKAFFNFKQLLSDREQFYQNTYGCLPFFKAGMHSGIVTVTEVGKYKKEIAYHGDTINTAARIQGKCNDLDSELLLSESLKEKLQRNSFLFKEMGKISLKGKQGKVMVHSVSEIKNRSAMA